MFHIDLYLKYSDTFGDDLTTFFNPILFGLALLPGKPINDVKFKSEKAFLNYKIFRLDLDLDCDSFAWVSYSDLYEYQKTRSPKSNKNRALGVE